jgi:hypothetical protein
VSAGLNLVGDASGSTGFSGALNDIVGTAQEPIDPLLGPLADHGGLTLTHELLAGSPAIDHAAVTCDSPDQRGVARPQGPRCDIGAFERAAPGGCSSAIGVSSDPLAARAFGAAVAASAFLVVRRRRRCS